MIRRISGPRTASASSNIELILFVTITWIFSISLILITSSDNEKEKEEVFSRNGPINTTEDKNTPSKIYDHIRGITQAFINTNEELEQQPNDEEKQKYFAKPKKVITMDKINAVKHSLMKSFRYCYMFIKELFTLMKKITIECFTAAFNISFNIVRFILNLISKAFYWTKRISLYAYQCIVSFINSQRKVFHVVNGFIKEMFMQFISLIKRNFMKPYYMLKSLPSLCRRFLQKLCIILVKFIREIIPR